MDHCIGSLCLDRRICSVTPALSPCACAHPCLTAHHRCSCMDHGTHHVTRVTTCTEIPAHAPVLPRHQTVLARRHPEGYYYLGEVRHEEEPGVYLIAFSQPAQRRDLHPATLQKTPAPDIIQYHEALRHPILPGDTVLAPWEPQLTRYGPGLVILGLETRDPLRVTEDEELTVSFWNGRKASVPLGVAVWTSPTAHRRIVDALHRPISSRVGGGHSTTTTTTYLISDHCTTPTDHHHHPHHYWRHHSAHPTLTHPLCTHPTLTHPLCTQPTLTHPLCTHSCLPGRPARTRCPDWWALTPRTTIYIPKQEEDTLHSHSRQRESPRTPEVHYPSSSGSDSEVSLEDVDTDGETDQSMVTKSSMVDSGVNTDSSLWERPQLGNSDRPDWKYWKHTQPEPFYKKPVKLKLKSKKSIKDQRAVVPDLIGSTNRSALFETISTSPAKRLTVKDLLLHLDFAPSEPKKSPPIAERLGQSEAEKFRHEQKVLEKRLEHKVKHREWEQKREDESLKKNSETQEAHRKKTLQRLRDEELTLRNQETKNNANMKAKMAASEERRDQRLTIAAEDKKREERRLEHMRRVRETADQREFLKCSANEQREIQRLATQRQKVDNRYRELAEKVLQAEL